MIRRRGMILACALLWLVLPAGATQGAEPAPRKTSPELEAEYLRGYVFLICVGASYEALTPAPARILAMLRDEAWVFVEKGSVGAEVYARLHPLAVSAGRAIPPMAAMRGCMAWSQGEEAHRPIADAVATLRQDP